MLDPAGPIGIFDSGLGGLSVLRAVQSLLPGEDIVYVADSGNAPYGERDDDFIADRSNAIGEWLLREGAKALVVACNTATAQAVHLLREWAPVPVVGVEPGLKPASTRSVSGVAGVLATAATLRSEKFRRLLAEHQSRCRFICQPGHGLVEAIERGETDSPELRALLERYLAPMLAEGADTLVLGCTHYPFIDTAIQRATGDRLALIDTSAAIAQQLARLLKERNLLTPSEHPIQTRLCSTGDGRQLQAVAHRLLNLKTTVEQLSIASRRTLPEESAPSAASA
ncbi:Glutamate racemase [Pararobbsia alpina]|uniref:Glutamate racemase n=1 Tax=Pararobbsia alpina TaxID=621374 RepID=A0A6S7B334_9BURK|nr:Glutamate racemase [Pararobbsia alpina]